MVLFFSLFCEDSYFCFVQAASYLSLCVFRVDKKEIIDAIHFEGVYAFHLVHFEGADANSYTYLLCIVKTHITLDHWSHQQFFNKCRSCSSNIVIILHYRAIPTCLLSELGIGAISSSQDSIPYQNKHFRILLI